MNLIPLLVFRPGNKVALGENLTGEIVSVCILCNNHIQYKVSWWNGNEHNERWLEAFQIGEPSEETAIAIGYK